jgi:PAS domain S-box-containing protein
MLHGNHALSAELVHADAATLVEQQGNEIFRLLVEGIRDYAIFLLDPQGRVVSWNTGAQRIKGYRADEIIGRHFSTFYTPEALATDWPTEELRRAREDGRFEDEGWRVRKDGTRFWANVIITALRDGNGKLLGFSKVTRDLTERREHEERLHQSEERFRLLVEGVKDHAIFLLDADGNVLSWNAGAQRVLGFTKEEALGRNLMMFYPEEDVATGKPSTELAIARNAGFSEDIGWRVRSDGSYLWADMTLTALREDDKVLRGFALIIRDLTERRRMQQLETEGRRINEFIAMLAHELRNPLAPIGNAVGILEKVANTPELVWCTKLIGRQVVHLARLVDDLLDVSRITSGKIQLRRAPVELNAVVVSAVESVRSTVEGYGHALEVKLPDAPVLVEGDATRVTQLIVNLVNNAAKYTPNGGRISVRLDAQRSVARIHVVDNGIGMSKRLMETAFDLFVQGDRALDRSEGGLGIGLTLVKRIAQLHGGTVSVASAGIGKGSEFIVTLPLLSAITQAQDALHDARSVVSRKILVVDDNQDAAHSLAALLRMSGHEVSAAHDGLEALRCVAADPPDVVLLDLGLPMMDGYEIARRMRDMPQMARARIVAMTGYGQDSHRQASQAAGFDAHLLKPVAYDELAKVLDDRTRPGG